MSILEKVGQFAAYTSGRPIYPLKFFLQTKENWDELTFAKASGTVKKNWPIAERRVPSNDLRDHYGTHVSSSSFLLSKVVNSNEQMRWLYAPNESNRNIF